NSVTEKFGDVYSNGCGHIELQYTARASHACNKAFGAPLGKSFGLMVGAPAAIGVVMADTALKAANVEVLGYCSPNKGTSFSNEVILTVCGDSGAVRQAVLAAKEVGVKLLEAMGGSAPSSANPYI
ncbi:MAG: propanediol utilization microcompartment protein PduB, partial [Fusobacteriaceae bacterium]